MRLPSTVVALSLCGLAALGCGGGDDGDGDARHGSSTSSSGGGGGGSAPDAGPRAMRLWQGDTAIDADARTKLFAFCADHEVTRVYVESESLVVDAPSALVGFVADASAHGVETELLFGAPTWADASQHDYAVGLARAAATLTKSMSTAAPVAVHFDVEPHALERWYTDQAGLTREYLDLLDALRGAVEGSGLALNVDIPFWYDTIQVERGGVSGPLDARVIDATSEATLMDYRDGAAPPGGLIDNAAAEVTYASAVEKRVRLGVETNCGRLLPDKVTFCEEGNRGLEAALGAVRQAYGDDPGFAGFAIHDYVGYSKLER